MTKTELEQAVNTRLQQIENALEPMEDSMAVNFATLFPVWAENVSYTTDYRVQYNDKLYKCVQAHISQAGWEPSNVPALWTEIAKPGEIPVWKQPTGAQDAYHQGDKVYYPTKDDSIYISDIDGNVWEPTVYGWSLEV